MSITSGEVTLGVFGDAGESDSAALAAGVVHRHPPGGTGRGEDDGAAHATTMMSLEEAERQHPFGIFSRRRQGVRTFQILGHPVLLGMPSAVLCRLHHASVVCDTNVAVSIRPSVMAVSSWHRERAAMTALAATAALGNEWSDTATSSSSHHRGTAAADVRSGSGDRRRRSNTTLPTTDAPNASYRHGKSAPAAA